MSAFQDAKNRLDAMSADEIAKLAAEALPHFALMHFKRVGLVPSIRAMLLSYLESNPDKGRC